MFMWRYPLHSWVVDILPYIERSDIADRWAALSKNSCGRLTLFDEPDSDGNYKKNGNSHYALSQTYLALLVCPDDDTVVPDRGNLSYVVNGGAMRFWWFPKNNHTYFSYSPRLRLSEA